MTEQIQKTMELIPEEMLPPHKTMLEIRGVVIGFILEQMRKIMQYLAKDREAKHKNPKRYEWDSTPYLESAVIHAKVLNILLNLGVKEKKEIVRKLGNHIYRKETERDPEEFCIEVLKKTAEYLRENCIKILEIRKMD